MRMAANAFVGIRSRQSSPRQNTTPIRTFETTDEEVQSQKSPRRWRTSGLRPTIGRSLSLSRSRSTKAGTTHEIKSIKSATTWTSEKPSRLRRTLTVGRRSSPTKGDVSNDIQSQSSMKSWAPETSSRLSRCPSPSIARQQSMEVRAGPPDIQSQRSLTSRASQKSSGAGCRSNLSHRSSRKGTEQGEIKSQNSSTSLSDEKLAKDGKQANVARQRSSKDLSYGLPLTITRQNSLLSQSSTKMVALEHGVTSLARHDTDSTTSQESDDNNGQIVGGAKRAVYKLATDGSSPTFSTRRLRSMKGSSAYVGKDVSLFARARSTASAYAPRPSISQTRTASVDDVKQVRLKGAEAVVRTPHATDPHMTNKARQSTWLRVSLLAIREHENKGKTRSSQERGRPGFDNKRKDARSTIVDNADTLETDDDNTESRFSLTGFRSACAPTRATFSDVADDTSILAEHYTGIDDDDSVASMDLLCKWLTCEQVELTEAEVHTKQQKAIAKGKLQGTLVRTDSGTEFIVPISLKRAATSAIPNQAASKDERRHPHTVQRKSVPQQKSRRTTALQQSRPSHSHRPVEW